MSTGGWRKKSHASSRSQTTTTPSAPPGQLQSVVEGYIFRSRPCFSQRGGSCLIVPAPSSLPLNVSSKGLSFGAAGLFMVASYCCEETRGRLPAASYRVFNEDLLLLLLLQGAGCSVSEDTRSQGFLSSRLLLFMLGGQQWSFFFFSTYIQSFRDADWVILSWLSPFHPGGRTATYPCKEGSRYMCFAHMDPLAGTWELAINGEFQNTELSLVICRFEQFTCLRLARFRSNCLENAD